MQETWDSISYMPDQINKFSDDSAKPSRIILDNRFRHIIGLQLEDNINIIYANHTDHILGGQCPSWLRQVQVQS